ncbi:MAG TPA: MerR family transcriptional regulator [Candidatus Binatia bacterium]|nr:MerR family transcriptional regulator [Candidatus Binatia bacterium]
MTDELLTYRELAQRLRVKPSTIRFWARQGLPCEPRGKLRFYSFSVARAWLQERYEAQMRAKRDRQIAA